MQNNKFAKISILILTIALCVGAVFAISINADETTPETKPVIVSQNVAYQGNFALMYAVDATTAAAPVTLYTYNAYPEEDTPYTDKFVAESATPGADSGLGKDAFIFRTTGVPASEMTSWIYVQAVDKNGNKSDIKRYSVAEYLYERLASGKASPDQKELYNSVIAFGDNAQIVVGGLAEDDANLISNLSYVTVTGGTINGYTKGVYPAGKSIFIKPTGGITATWKLTATDSAGASTESTVKGAITVPDAVNVAVTMDTLVPYRDGIDTLDTLSVKSNGSFNNSIFINYDNTDVGLGKGLNEVVTDPLYGTVAKHTINTEGGSFRILPNNTLPEGTTATAFEVSFDMKMILPYLAPADNNRVELQLRTSGGSSIHRIEFIDATSHLSEEVDKGKFNIRSSQGTSSGNKIIYGSDLTDWNHVRIVMFTGDDKNAYVYINGSDDPAVIQVYGSSYSAADVGMLQFQTETNSSKSSAGVQIFVDNVFCGFTTETKQ